MKQTNVP